ncbi:MAG: sulfatase activating formylglycine-generating enzyme [Planctomycetaceae bacterium]|jgi:formylglycine-generating enzyme required for sulfatase activity/tRNA A-37 threonylcarbamoyl transferase component Bud32
MPKDDASLSDQPTFEGGTQASGPASLGDQQTFEGGGQASDSADHSLGDQSTFGGGDASSMSDFGGAATDADFDMEVVDLSSRYTIEGALGKGGMGEVLLATDTRLKRQVAIKRVLGHMAQSRTAVLRFLTEAQSIAALNHFNIVQIYDYGRDKDGPFLIMEYVDGGSLLDRCREGALPLEEAVELTCQLCDGLGKAHDAGIIHRDIKPANVLLTEDDVPKLTDFGLARQDSEDSGMTVTGAVLGTLDFMSPEQRKDAALTDHRSDLWSLAATLYQLVTGKSPKIIRFNDVPQALQDVLGKALEEEKEDRYQTAIEFRDALQASLQVDASLPTAVDLGAGECSQCHTKNEPSRKFCRDCAASLQSVCLQCEKPILVWDKVCGECGGTQSELLEIHRLAMSELREGAEVAHDDLQYDTAVALAEQVLSECDTRFVDLVSWAESFRQSTLEERQLQQQRAGEQYAESQQHRVAWDYKSAIRVMEAIPETVLSEEMVTYLAQLRSDLVESRLLMETIADRVKRRDLVGLLEQVERAIELRGNRSDLMQLQGKLTERQQKQDKTHERRKLNEQTLLDRAEVALRAAQLSKVETALETISTPVFDHDRFHCLQADLAGQQDRGKALKPFMKRDLDNASITETELSHLLTTADEFLERSPDFAPLTELKSRFRAAIALRKRQKSSRMKRVLGATVVVVLTSVGLWHYFSTRASAIGEAVQQQQWDDVLALDSQNVMALIERAKQRLEAATPAIDGAFEDLSVAEAVDASAEGLQATKALAYAKRAMAMARVDHVSDAEEDLQKAEALGAPDSELTRARQLLVAAYMKRAEDGVTRGDVPGIRAACDAAERYQASDSDLSRLRAEAFKSEGEQKQESGDLAGALTAFDEAVKLNNSLGLRTERAVLHVKLGEQAVTKRDYAVAATELKSAVSLDMSATGVVALAGSVSEPVVVAFEQDPTAVNQTAAIATWRSVSRLDATAATTVELRDRLIALLSRPALAFEQEATAVNLTAALAAIASIQSVDAQNGALPVLRQRVTVAVMKRGESVADNDPDSALQDYEAALSLGASSSESASLKGQLVTALNARCRQSLTRQDVSKALADHVVLQNLAPQSADGLLSEFEKLPAKVLSQLPASVLLQVPPRKNSIGMEFKLLPGGTFTMGEDKEAHQVTLTKPFEMAVYELTQGQASQLRKVNSSIFKGPENPVEQVSWDEAVALCRNLSALPAEKSSGYVYRLPTEAEWEYACRAGTKTGYSFGDSESELGEYAWYDDNSERTTHPVGGKKANPWGLYDMYGNVWEWCQDRHGDFPNGPVTDPTGPALGSYRVERGGSWGNSARYSRSAYRDRYTPDYRGDDVGFRVLRSSVLSGK